MEGNFLLNRCFFNLTLQLAFDFGTCTSLATSGFSYYTFLIERHNIESRKIWRDQCSRIIVNGHRISRRRFSQLFCRAVQSGPIICSFFQGPFNVSTKRSFNYNGGVLTNMIRVSCIWLNLSRSMFFSFGFLRSSWIHDLIEIPAPGRDMFSTSTSSAPEFSWAS